MDHGEHVTASNDDSMQHEMISKIVDTLKGLVSAEWPQNTLLNVYLFGSRLYGVHKPSSDYDFIGICGGEYFYAYRLIDSVIAAESSPTGEAIDVNINMMHITYFRETLKDAFINSVMLCFMPTKFIFLETVDIRSEFILHLPNIRQSVQMDSTHNFAKAKRLWRLGDFYTSKKNIVHGIRYLNYSLQLLGPKGTIYDFTAGNEYWSEVMALKEPQKDNPKENSSLWQAIDLRFAPIYKDLTDKMKEYCDREVIAAQEWEWRWISQFYGEPNLSAVKQRFRHSIISPQILIDYIKEFGLDTVSRRFGVVYTRHKTSPNLISLGRTQMAALELSLVQWCSGIVLNEDDNFSIVALPFPKIFASTSDSNVFPVIDWQSEVTVESLLDGRLAVLYFYAGQWHVGSAESPDGAEQIGWVSPIRLPNWRDYVVDGFNFNPVHEANMLIDLQGNGLPNPTFSEHFWQIAKSCGLEISNLDCRKTYLFEVQSPWLTHIIDHKEREAILLGVRRQEDSVELDVHEVAKEMKWNPKLLTTKWILDGEDDASLPLIPLAPGITRTAKAVGLNSDDQDTTTEHKAQRKKKKVYNQETGSANLAPLTLFDAINSRLRFFDPTKQPGLLVKTKDGRRLMFRSAQFTSLDKLHPLSDDGQVQKLLLELSRCLCERTWLQNPKYDYWIAKFVAVDENYQAAIAYMQSIWDEARSTVKNEGRAAGATFLTKHPVVSSELHLLIKWQTLDVTIQDHCSKIPLKRLQQLLRKVTELLETQKSSKT